MQLLSPWVHISVFWPSYSQHTVGLCHYSLNIYIVDSYNLWLILDTLRRIGGEDCFRAKYKSSTPIVSFIVHSTQIWCFSSMYRNDWVKSNEHQGVTVAYASQPCCVGPPFFPIGHEESTKNNHYTDTVIGKLSPFTDRANLQSIQQTPSKPKKPQKTRDKNVRQRNSCQAN